MKMTPSYWVHRIQEQCNVSDGREYKKVGVCFQDRMVHLIVKILLVSAGGPTDIGSGQFKMLGCVQEGVVENI